MKTPKIKPYSLRFPLDVYGAVKARAVESGETMTDIILAAIRKYLKLSAPK